jgi:hypothetical protein
MSGTGTVTMDAIERLLAIEEIKKVKARYSGSSIPETTKGS